MVVGSNLVSVTPSKVIFSFSKYEISNFEKKLLAKYLTFSLPSMYLDCTDYLVNFELFYRNMLNLGILSVKNLAFLKTMTKETALCSYRIYNHNVPQYLSKEEFLA